MPKDELKVARCEKCGRMNAPQDVWNGVCYICRKDKCEDKRALYLCCIVAAISTTAFIALLLWS